jgi:methyltransferase-like protein/2-polyprenyl-3-methyl-5-hydroxy-6-metoxy-1,4-benzoquinol methylase
MSEPVQTAYDSVIYPGYAYDQTHPDHVATYARLCGLDPAPVETCRVLEVGCGDAANLLPMAVTLPQATFQGFDLAASSIERGRAVARELGLANLTLEHLDINEAAARMGEFDYVIAHGFYSWVPQSARDQLMAICRSSLAPQGVAFISYNAFPGGYIRRMVREMMLFHVDRAPDPETKTTQARALLGFLSKLTAGDNEYQLVLKKELERVLQYKPAHLYHDDLAPIFDCFDLHEFVAHAAAYDLQFLADMNSTFFDLEGLDAESVRVLSGLGANPVIREQYLDFAYCRRFRQTLLCHASLPLVRQADPVTTLDGLLMSTPTTTVVSDADIRSEEEVVFRGPQNTSLKTANPMVKAALAALALVWPERLSLNEVREQVAARLEVPLHAVPAELLARGLVSAFGLRMLDLHTHKPRLANRPGERPRTTPLIRLQAGKGQVLTNLLHHAVKVEGQGERLLSLLDGRRTRADLAAEMNSSLADIDEALAKLARLALIEA